MEKTWSGLIKNGAIQSTDSMSDMTGMMTAGLGQTPDILKKFREGAIIQPSPIPGTSNLIPGEEIRGSLSIAFQKGVSAGTVAERLSPSELNEPDLTEFADEWEAVQAGGEVPVTIDQLEEKSGLYGGDLIAKYRQLQKLPTFSSISKELEKTAIAYEQRKQDEESFTF
jgi:hypothetical protein